MNLIWQSLSEEWCSTLQQRSKHCDSSAVMLRLKTFSNATFLLFVCMLFTNNCKYLFLFTSLIKSKTSNYCQPSILKVNTGYYLKLLLCYKMSIVDFTVTLKCCKLSYQRQVIISLKNDIISLLRIIKDILAVFFFFYNST